MLHLDFLNTFFPDNPKLLRNPLISDHGNESYRYAILELYTHDSRPISFVEIGRKLGKLIHNSGLMPRAHAARDASRASAM